MPPVAVAPEKANSTPATLSINRSSASQISTKKDGVAAGPSDKKAGHLRASHGASYLPDIVPFFRTPKIMRVSVPDGSPLRAPPRTPLLNLFKKSLAERSTLTSFFRAGSVRGSVFNLCSATLGAGALSLPYAFSKTGLILGVVLLVLATITTDISIHMLVVARNVTGLSSYEELTVALFGKRVGYLVEAMIIIFCFGTAVAYCKAVGDILNPVLDLAPLPSWLQGNVGKKISICMFWALFMLPLSLLRTMNSLRFSSFFGVCSIFYLVVATLIYSAQSPTAFTPELWGSWSFLGPSSFVAVVQVMPVMMFAFTCQVNVPAIYSELEHASIKRFKSVSRGAVGTCFGVYLMIGIAGFSSFADNTQGNILTNYCIQSQRKPYIVAATFAIVVTIVMAFPLNVFPCRYTLETMIIGVKEASNENSKDDSHAERTRPRKARRSLSFGGDAGKAGNPSANAKTYLLKEQRQMQEKQLIAEAQKAKAKLEKRASPLFLHTLLTFLIAGGALLVSLFVPNINIVFSLMGSTASAFVCFVLPAAAIIKLKKLEEQAAPDDAEVAPFDGASRAPDVGMAEGMADKGDKGSASSHATFEWRLTRRASAAGGVKQLSEINGVVAWALAVGGTLTGVLATSLTVYGMFVTAEVEGPHCTS